MRISLLVGLAGILLCGCAGPYHRRSYSGWGYSEHRISADAFSVEFAGKSGLPRASVEAYLLRRCAEIALREGGSYFIVVEHFFTRWTAVAVIKIASGEKPADCLAAYDAQEVMEHTAAAD
ncbi:MAG: CC0125/CC1285 family lipoprotein [Planctomycetota bacterium]